MKIKEIETGTIFDATFLRMLQSKELYPAQGFPKNYTFEGG